MMNILENIFLAPRYSLADISVYLLFADFFNFTIYMLEWITGYNSLSLPRIITFVMLLFSTSNEKWVACLTMQFGLANGIKHTQHKQWLKLDLYSWACPLKLLQRSWEHVPAKPMIPEGRRETHGAQQPQQTHRPATWSRISQDGQHSMIKKSMPILYASKVLRFVMQL